MNSLLTDLHQLVGILCTNAPAIKPLFPSWLRGSSVKPSATSGQGSNLVTIGGSGAIKLSSRNKKSKIGLDTAIIYENDSEERIICQDTKDTQTQTPHAQSGITVQTSTYQTSSYHSSSSQAPSYQASSYHGSDDTQRHNEFHRHVDFDRAV